MVMKVANHYQVCRVLADGYHLAPLEAIDGRFDALLRACRLVTGAQRVFLNPEGSRRDCVEIDCAQPYWLR